MSDEPERDGPSDRHLIGLLSSSLKEQTAAVKSGFSDLREDIRGIGDEMRAEARSMRRAWVVIASLAMILVVGIVGVSVVVNIPGLVEITTHTLTSTAP